jgi:predicted hotdog family 3-hydroxylacyl-ACP dehydratase
MRTHRRPSLLLGVLLLASASSVHAQATVDPSGHWEGTVQASNMALKVEIDLARNSLGVFAGTFSQPAQGVKGLPLSSIAVEASTVRFVVKGGPDAATFDGALSADGTSISGTVTQGGFTIPINLSRTGDARIVPAPKSAPIAKELEGTWNGALDIDGAAMRLVVKMANQPDGTAAGTVVSPDGSGVEIPIGMTQNGSTVTIDVPSVGASYVAVLNPARTELTGTWTQRDAAFPLTLRLVK